MRGIKWGKNDEMCWDCWEWEVKDKESDKEGRND